VCEKEDLVIPQLIDYIDYKIRIILTNFFRNYRISAELDFNGRRA
jgi:hypothetical protein